MTEPLYWVIVRAKTRGRKLRRRRFSIVKRMGPMSYSEARATKEGASINLDRKRFTIQMSADRGDYWARYHRRRYETDETYRINKRKNALEWQRSARAAAKGNVTPWLTLE